jgi:hypothetical protein
LVTREPRDRGYESSQQPHGAFHDSVENRLNVRLGAANDPQDIAGRGLLVECGSQLAVARLELGEQPDILDRDDGLVGERLQQRDLAIRERKRRGLGNTQNADDDFALQERDE